MPQPSTQPSGIRQNFVPVCIRTMKFQPLSVSSLCKKSSRTEVIAPWQSCRATDRNDLLDVEQEILSVPSRESSQPIIRCSDKPMPAVLSECMQQAHAARVRIRNLWPNAAMWFRLQGLCLSGGPFQGCPRFLGPKPRSQPNVSANLLEVGIFGNVGVSQSSPREFQAQYMNLNLSSGISVPLAAQGAQTLRNTTSEEARPTTSASTNRRSHSTL